MRTILRKRSLSAQCENRIGVFNMTSSDAVKLQESGHKDLIHGRMLVTFLRPDGILQVDVKEGAEFHLEDAKESIKAQKILVRGKKRPLLVNLAGVRSMSREAREYLGGAEAAENVSVVAIVISSFMARMIGNFFIGLNKTLYPTRLFNSQQDALAWLKEPAQWVA